MEDRAGAVFCPAKPKTERVALGICRVWMPWVRIVYRGNEVRKMQWWWWWDARNRRSGGARVLPCQTENRARRARYRSVWMMMAQVVYRDYGARKMLWWWWCMPGTGDQVGPGFCPAKPKTERDVLGTGRV